MLVYLALGIPNLCLPQTGITSRPSHPGSFYLYPRDLNSGTHACVQALYKLSPIPGTPGSAKFTKPCVAVQDLSKSRHNETVSPLQAIAWAQLHSSGSAPQNRVSDSPAGFRPERALSPALKLLLSPSAGFRLLL